MNIPNVASTLRKPQQQRHPRGLLTRSLIGMSSLGFVWLPLGCRQTEPQATTPQTAPSAASSAPVVSAPVVSAPSATQPPNTTVTTPSPAVSTAGTAPSGHTWPLAVGGEQPAPPSDPAHSASTAQGEPQSAAAGGAALAQSGQESSKISGCLSNAKANQAPTRSGPAPIKEPWRATAMGNAVLVTHTFDHACCLTGKTTSSISGKTITVEEHLTGEPCRCVCQSTIQTRVPASAGTYDVRTVTITNGKSETSATQRVTVGITARPKAP